MEQLGELNYEMAVAFFENGNYELAVERFIKAYESGVYREEILENLYACFITPNEEEFRKNYKENSEGILTVPYEDLTMDFIPVSDTKFYLFDRQDKSFHGCMELDAAPERISVEFQSLLIADNWDFREIWSVMKEREWNTVYIVLNQEKERLASFFKLPQFQKTYLHNVVIFESSEIMKQFFEAYPEFYLPRQLFVSDEKYYTELIEQLHLNRIQAGSEQKKKVFLSICVPSYNRGSRALEAVKAVCASKYDNEIEIIISDNASETDTEGYQIIKDMCDSRVIYHKNESNVGALENILCLLEKARGKYAVLSSDEDILIAENLPYYMDLIHKYGYCGSIVTGGIGGSFIPNKWEKHLAQKGGKAVLFAINDNYMTGTCYNMELLRKEKVIEAVREKRDNVMVESYPHCFMGMKLALVSDIMINTVPPLWLAGEPADDAKASSDVPKEYMLVEAREEQFVAAINLSMELGVQGNVLLNLYLDRYWKFLWLIYICTVHYEKYFKARNITWQELSQVVRDKCIENVKLLKGAISPEEKKDLLTHMEGMYQKISKEGFSR